jgi:DNA-binding PadR family transcriptional regulator
VESKIAYALTRRIIKNFMDVIILKHLKNNHSMSGYDVIRLLHRKFHLLTSPGTVYSVIYSLERQNLIEGRMAMGKRLYRLTSQGEKLVAQTSGTNSCLQAIISTIFSDAQG